MNRGDWFAEFHPLRFPFWLQTAVGQTCGYGKNKTNYSDTTGLFAQVALISE